MVKIKFNVSYFLCKSKVLLFIPGNNHKLNKWQETQAESDNAGLLLSKSILYQFHSS